MHDSVLQFVRDNLTEAEVRGKCVLEIGAYNVNGSVRPMIEAMGPASYRGVDIRRGPLVDAVEDWCEVLYDRYDEPQFDIVISTEMLEHCSRWRVAVTNMKCALDFGGLLLLTTRSPGFPRHEHPEDFHRFSMEDFQKIFADMEILVLQNDPQVPGVFIKARRPIYPCDLNAIEVSKAPGA